MQCSAARSQFEFLLADLLPPLGDVVLFAQMKTGFFVDPAGGVQRRYDVLAIDLDGTLLGADNSVSVGAAEATTLRTAGASESSMPRPSA